MQSNSGLGPISQVRSPSRVEPQFTDNTSAQDREVCCSSLAECCTAIYSFFSNYGTPPPMQPNFQNRGELYPLSDQRPDIKDYGLVSTDESDLSESRYGLELELSSFKILRDGETPAKHTIVAENDYWQLQVERGVSENSSAGLEFVLRPLDTWSDIKKGLRSARELFQALTKSVDETGKWEHNGFIVTPENPEIPLVSTIAPQITTSFGLAELSSALDLALEFSSYNSRYINQSLQNLALLDDELSKKTPELQGFTKMVVATLACFNHEDHFEEGPKEVLPLMPRTDFHTMYNTLVESDKKQFQDLIPIIKSLFAPMVFKENKSTVEGQIPVREGAFHITNISVDDWLQSIVMPPDDHGKDLLSPPRAYLTESVRNYYTEYSMGALGVDSASGNPIFEFRCAKKLMNYKPTTGGNLVENVRGLFKNVTSVTGDKRRADSDTSSDTIDTRNEVLTQFQEARELLGGNPRVNTFWKFPNREKIPELIEKIRHLPFESKYKEDMCTLLESSKLEFKDISPKEDKESKMDYIKRLSEIDEFNAAVPIFTDEIIPLAQILLSVLNQTEMKNAGDF